MQFIFADSQDMVDPEYDFGVDRSKPGRERYWDDRFPHEMMQAPPYHGMLISRGALTDRQSSGIWNMSQTMRLRREGARSFLRLPEGMPIFGDCGAFQYVNQDVPPYSVENMVDFYEEAGFTHGFSVDHIIFEYHDGQPSDQALFRYQLTLELAEKFLKEHRQAGASFTPIGVAQGWSPSSKAMAARELVKMGYDYVALGGGTKIKTPQIQDILEAVRSEAQDVRIHLLGFGKCNDFDAVDPYDVTSFDTSSPMLRAFKDADKNYYLQREDGSVEFFTAIRIPCGWESSKITAGILSGSLSQDETRRTEKEANQALRAYASRETSLDTALEKLIAHSKHFSTAKQITQLRKKYRRTLEAKPWETCDCDICKAAGVEVIVFRGTNRNKRRGMHNLRVFQDSLEGRNQARNDKQRTEERKNVVKNLLDLMCRSEEPGAPAR